MRLPRDDRSGKLKGFGYIEFGDRDSFISALLKYEAVSLYLFSIVFFINIGFNLFLHV